MNREEWLNGFAAHMRAAGTTPSLSRYGGRNITFLPSFPARNRRAVVVGDITRQANDGRTLALVSPLISDSTEVSIVAHWLSVRSDYGITDHSRLNTAANGRTMEWAGYNTPYKSCVPTERLITAVATLTESWVQANGEYPAEYVDLGTRPVQETRLIKMVCDNPHAGYGLRNDAYVLRMSNSTIAVGAPYCGICNERMVRG